MPVRAQRTRKKKQNLEVLTPGQLESLLDDHMFFGNVYPDDETRRHAWKLHRDELMEYWLQDPDAWLEAGNKGTFGTPQPGGPGTRPSSWWEYTANKPLNIVTAAEQIDQETAKRGKPQYDDPSFYHDREETEVSYLHQLKLLSPAELEYLNKISPDPSDWDFLQWNDWLTAHGRREWFRMWCRNLTDKGVESRRLDLLYLQKLGLSPVIPRSYMGPESDHSAAWKLADLIILPD
jgi:hypothetical protein